MNLILNYNFQKQKFYINSDFNLSQRSSNAIKFVIERHGGLIIKKFDVSEIDIYLGKYRQGDTYKKVVLVIESLWGIYNGYILFWHLKVGLYL